MSAQNNGKQDIIERDLFVYVFIFDCQETKPIINQSFCSNVSNYPALFKLNGSKKNSEFCTPLRQFRYFKLQNVISVIADACKGKKENKFVLSAILLSRVVTCHYTKRR